jgi:iron complex transport system substrate-binding protein
MGAVRFWAMALAGAIMAVAPAYSQGVSDAPAPPARVVSMNLCTDQLAMMLAAPDQLLSVSHLSFDPRGSAMADEAARYLPNHGLAEEIYLLQPDLVIAGSFSTRATVSMLRRLGLPVVVMEPAYSLDEVRDRITEMGAVLHRRDEAARMVAQYDRDLAALTVNTPDTRPLAALYYARGYTSGDRTLAGQILSAAGFRNAAVEAGLPMGGIFPLEMLALSDPDALITGRRYPGASRAEEILDHPVVRALASNRMQGSVTDRDWVCGTPHVLRAIAGLTALHDVQGPAQ